MSHTRKFKDISKTDIDTFGGKTASLGEMLRAGIPVPDGFGISTSAFTAFSGKDFSEDFKNELHTMFNDLGVDRVAVRSSAIAEDSSTASWAGQLETYLNVNEKNLETAIRKCWKSIQSEHAQSYASDKSLEETDLYVGVAVQKMIDSQVAGVMFTANPVTNNKNEILIESAYGLGEIVVQGSITPDRYVFNKKENQVTEFDISIKRKMMVYKNGKNQTLEVPERLEDKTSLWEDNITNLAIMGMKIEKHYKQAMDIEWAIKDGNIYILQSRPITTV